MSKTSRREERELHAFRDGELPFWRRRRVARRLARDARAQRELESIDALRELLREQAAALPTPELWEGVRARLATAARPEPSEAAAAPPLLAGWLPTWLGAALAAASVAGLVASSMLAGDAGPVGSLRWLDSKGKPVLVLKDDRSATIIWVLPGPQPAGAEA